MRYDSYYREAKHRMEQVVKMLQKTEGVCIDIGCYIGCLKSMLPKGVSYKGIDVKKWNDNVNILCNIDKGLPLEDKSADIVIATGIIEHTIYPNQLMQEINRVCKADGEIIISTPNAGSPIARAKKFIRKIDNIEEQKYGHHWEFNVKTGKQFVSKYFKIINQKDYFSHRLEFLHKLNLRGEQFFYCRKMEEVLK